jgi:REP element-mobilizing transposase RayT
MTNPIYDPSRVDPAYHLRYSWTGWPSCGKFSSTPTDVLEGVAPLWEQDGIRLLEHRWTPEQIQVLFSTKPSVSPALLAARAKGRLDHALRTADLTMDFSRKIAVRSVGDNTRTEVEAYIEGQVGKEQFVDPEFERAMQAFTVVDHEVDLSAPASSARGRYWYNLHLVFVVEQRHRVYDPQCLTTIRESSLRIARKKGYAISRLAVMPDHLHVALRGDQGQSPNEIVYAFQNNLAYAIGQRHLWEDTFYVGTFGEYDMDAVRQNM